MTNLTKYKMISTAFACSVLSGCGTYVPGIQEFYETPKDAAIMVEAIVEQVQCEVKTAVQDVIIADIDLVNVRKDNGLKAERKLSWLDTWAAQATLTLTIDEKSALNPGLSLNTPMHNAPVNFVGEVIPPSSASAIAARTFSFLSVPQSYALGLGGTFSADATRKETLSLFIDFKDFTNKAALEKARLGKEKCYPGNGVFIQSDLKLREWLFDTTLGANVEGGIVPNYAKSLGTEAKLSKKDVISHEITFVIVYGGNITPSWKLVRVSANQGSLPLFNAQRTRTQDLLITMGPPQNGTLVIAAQNTTLASQIGIAVANAIRNTQ